MNAVKWRWLPLLLAAVATARADDPLDGFQDRSFAGTGVGAVTYALSDPSLEYAADLARFSNGRLYQLATVSVQAGQGINYRTGVARFMPDGQPDLSFSGDGKVVFSGGPDPSAETRASRILVQSDGKPIVLSMLVAFGDLEPANKSEVCRLAVGASSCQRNRLCENIEGPVRAIYPIAFESDDERKRWVSLPRARKPSRIKSGATNRERVRLGKAGASDTRKERSTKEFQSTSRHPGLDPGWV